MLEYISNVSYLSVLKLKGKKIEDQKCVQRLAELRCVRKAASSFNNFSQNFIIIPKFKVFDKVKPIEAKLKYQIDKALKLAENPNLGNFFLLINRFVKSLFFVILDGNNPLNFRPNTDNFDETAKRSDDESNEEADSDDEDDDQDKPSKKDGIYRPPKLAPVQCGMNF